MKYAYPLRHHMLGTKFRGHLSGIWQQVSEDHRKGLYKKDYIVPFTSDILVPELKEWIEQFNIKCSFKSYLAMERGWNKMEHAYHYIEFDDDQARMLFKLAWGGRGQG